MVISCFPGRRVARMGTAVQDIHPQSSNALASSNASSSLPSMALVLDRLVTQPCASRVTVYMPCSSRFLGTRGRRCRPQGVA